ncbi:MAG: serine hydrolase [Deltaproteobacteria bacterium]|nr:serine hydrolase [Deltaproteobacteria bacterium]MBW1794198.1 serine hydrolase [Deltaproteobacteria bacterium]MBW2330674.1 serine hydrolase [Deltaproteobacteria bacterium]
MKAVRDLMRRGVDEGVFPGGVLLVARKGSIVFFEAFGHAGLAPERPMTTDTVFDLASLTKPLATSVAFMLLVQEGKLSLDQTLGSAIPDFSGTNKKYITIRQLLSHTSGLPDYRPFYKKLVELPPSERKDSLRALLLAERFIHEPGQACLYSDLGFMILEWLVEVTAQKPLDRFVEESIYRPLGLKHLFFIPSPQTLPLEARPARPGAPVYYKPPSQQSRVWARGATSAKQAVAPENQARPGATSSGQSTKPIIPVWARVWAWGGGQGGGKSRVDQPYAATEDCPWRGKILDGVVHDENAYALGGVAGHAGLFGTAQDVYGLLKELLAVYTGKSNIGLFRRDVVQTFFQRQSDVGSWALGFDTPTRPDSSSGQYFSDQSVGHLGFTGTSFWVDLLKGVIVILLTNRIHAKRENEQIKAFRPLLHDTVMDSMLRQRSSTL